MIIKEAVKVSYYLKCKFQKSFSFAQKPAWKPIYNSLLLYTVIYCFSDARAQKLISATLYINRQLLPDVIVKCQLVVIWLLDDEGLEVRGYLNLSQTRIMVVLKEDYSYLQLFSDFLSLVTISSCLILKVPQIVNIIKLRSAVGINLIGLLMELSR